MVAGHDWRLGFPGTAAGFSRLLPAFGWKAWTASHVPSFQLGADEMNWSRTELRMSCLQLPAVDVSLSAVNPVSLTCRDISHAARRPRKKA